MAQFFTDMEGVFAHAVRCGLKKEKPDLSLIYVPNAVGSAGVFTRNRFSASSVTYTRKILKSNVIKAMIVNAGNANAGTGQTGEKDTKTMARETAKWLGLNPSQVGVASTGKIGCKMPMDKVVSGIEVLCKGSQEKNGALVAQAILTTDLCQKINWKESKIGKKTIAVAGITKGSGMIAPNMATTLSFVVTNAHIESEDLSVFLKQAIDDSYNMLSVDTDCSTNDMMIIFSTGQYKFERTPENDQLFQTLLTDHCIDLAKQIALDGEGATKCIEVSVEKAASKKDARLVAKQILDSPLVKTAMYGSDPNWGRIIAAAAKNPDVKLNPRKINLFLGPHQVMEAGEPIAFDAAVLKQYLKQSMIHIRLDLNLGHSQAAGWGCDLTERYVEINTEYN